MRAQGYGGPRRARVGASMCQVAWYGWRQRLPLPRNFRMIRCPDCVGRGGCACDGCGRVGSAVRMTRTCMVFINATTHPDPLCHTSVGSTLQQQGKGGGARGSELRAVVAVLSEHQCIPPPRRTSHPYATAPPQACPSCAPMRKSHRASVCTCMIHVKRAKKTLQHVSTATVHSTNQPLARGGWHR